MPQTFYIESDEEIISVIGRLRRSSGAENYFIFPKRSLVLQSIINLKLFQREAEKLGKKVIIVTQDETGIVLAEKAGLATERYTDDFSRKSAHLELVAPLTDNAPLPMSTERIMTENPKSEDLGSNEFYASPQDSTVTQVAPVADRTLRVRNMTPPKQTSLNSARSLVEPSQRVPSSQVSRPYPGAGMTATAFPQKRPQSISKSAPYSPTSTTFEPSHLNNEREERLKNFYTLNKETSFPKRAPESAPKHVALESGAVPSRMRGILFFLGGVSALSLIGVAAFLFLPRAEVHIIPYKMTQSVDLPFDGQFEGVLVGDTTLPVRIATKEHEIAMTVDATGVSSGTAQKSRGTIIIYNSYSAEPQSLVATTRFESPDGKVFRLSEGVTVPGMNGTQPGAIEAQVIADQPGADYNISSTTFTIPGFKGSPKFEKFSAKSNKAMAGGSQATGADFRIISKEDLDKAEALAKNKAKEAYRLAIGETLSPGERILEENLEIVPGTNSTLPTAGTVATSFDYNNTFSVRGFIFSETAIKDIIKAKGEETINGVVFRPTMIDLSYGEAIPDYENKKVRLKVRAIVDSESVIDQERLLQEILGKDGDGVNEVLTTFPAIKKIEIIFKPQWFTSVVPSSKSRVTIVLEPGSAD